MIDHFYEQVDGWFNFREIYDEAIRSAADGARFVEIGSWYGRSAAWMAVEVANSGKQIEFYCVDTWRGSPDTPWMGEQLEPLGGSCKQLFLENMRRGGVDDYVRPLELSSVEAAQLFDDGSIDFAFIDGAHDYDAVRADVRAWYPKIRRGGVIAGDDATWPGVVIGVRETIAESDYQLRNGGNNWWHRNVRREPGWWVARQPHPPLSDVLVYVPYVNGQHLLERAVHSLKPLWPSLIVIDQSEQGLDASWIDEVAGVYRVEFGALTFTQMMNWARAEAFDRAARLLVFVHHDAEVSDRLAACSIVAAARDRLSTGLGVAFTNYDALAVFSVDALRDVGPWDESFRWYFADNDYYYRLRHRGWVIAELGGHHVRHAASQTLRSDPRIAEDVRASWDWHTRHYIHKWGGSPGREQFTVPYNGAP